MIVSWHLAQGLAYSFDNNVRDHFFQLQSTLNINEIQKTVTVNYIQRQSIGKIFYNEAKNIDSYLKLGVGK